MIVKKGNRMSISLKLMIEYTLSKIKNIIKSQKCRSIIMKLLIILVMYLTDKALLIQERFLNLMSLDLNHNSNKSNNRQIENTVNISNKTTFNLIRTLTYTPRMIKLRILNQLIKVKSKYIRDLQLLAISRTTLVKLQCTLSKFQLYIVRMIS